MTSAHRTETTAGVVPDRAARASTARRRLLIVVTKLNQAGAQMVALNVARGLRARGHEASTVFLYREEPAFPGEPKVEVLLDRPPRGAADYLRILARLTAAVRRHRPDAVHTSLPLGNILGALTGLALRCPRRVASQHYPGDTQSAAMRRLDRLLGRRGVYTGNIAVSRSVADSYDGCGAAYRRRMTVIHNGVPPRASDLDRPAARALFGLPGHGPVLAFVGRLTRQKNPLLALDVLAGTPDATLVMAGEGELRPAIEARARALGVADRLRLLGRVDEASVPDVFRAADLLLVPSLYEGHPLIVIEAMLARVPLLASDIPSVREATADAAGVPTIATVHGFDPGNWCHAAARLLADSRSADEATEAAARRAAAFGLEPMIDAYEAALFGGPPP